MPHTSNVVEFPTGAVMDVGGKTIPLMPDGRLHNLDDWSPDVAAAMAESMGVNLTRDHWDVINLMRSYYGEYNVSPVRKLLKRALLREGYEELARDERLDSLFPGDVLVQGSKLAGVPVPHLDAELERRTYADNRAADNPQVKQSRAAGHFVGSFEFDGERYEVTPTGNLIDLHRWNERVAMHMAQKEGIELTAEHWEILNFLRGFYFEYGISPMVKILMRHMREEIGPEKASADYLYKLFPKGPSRQGSRIAGLPEPQGCIDG
ncbi:TusE/DsrC/DsvC family sulfur relay protein [Thiohalobacter thiocyanaticus]|uniref:TusE/DsrC/DsvC family sulfur relay protein n=1 Tax=Thiohalobacter thiocyanaticus TaxID=585455 RepID=A0A426QDZ1_9GAMM|nr:TusE/DsrC/DsvC family sulfur relay protein [Thiohalobacter thiocyanaticus]RRQ19966.1 TusE/DsrC/DsvC family sulfur relay protein [Thiohalobacter thiocyanaticus]